MKSNLEHTFTQVPKANIQRSTFNRSHGHKTTFNEGWLVPFYVDEVLPGDTFQCKATILARLAPMGIQVPVMDNIFLDTFFFFVPNRLVWKHWQNFMGEEETPGDYVNGTITYLTPLMTNPGAGGVPQMSIFDYMGVPPGVQNLNNSVGIIALPFRAYNLIYNEWFRDENLTTKAPIHTDDGPDPIGDYGLLTRTKRHDYFTSALPWPQKGPGVNIPIGPALAPVRTWAANLVAGAQTGVSFLTSAGGAVPSNRAVFSNATGQLGYSATAEAQTGAVYPSNLYADLTGNVMGTINSLRQAFQIQRLYERDARGGSRYTEIVRSHFGVISPDARLQRPEYLGGSSQRINISPVIQTSAANAQPTPQGNLAAIGTSMGAHGFTKSFTEHGWIIALLSVRVDQSYQYGLPRMYTRRTRFDYYWPVLANLGEQAIQNQEIYAQGTAADVAAFGYQERWAEYRYYPSQITGQFRSQSATPLDMWHLAQKFTALPTLGDTFIKEQAPISRIVAVTSQPHFFMDSFIEVKATRPMPVYSIPGMVDHF